MGRKRADKFPGWMPGLYRKETAKGFIYYTLDDGVYKRLDDVIDKARQELTAIQTGKPIAGTVGEMLDELMKYRWAKHRKSAKPGKPGKPSVRTLLDNATEVEKLKIPFGKILVKEFRRSHAYDYLHKYRGVDAPIRANREISLLSCGFEYEIDRGRLEVNPCAGVEKNEEESRDRFVTHEELISFCNFAIANAHHVVGSSANSKKDSDSGRRIALASQLAYLTSKAEGQILRIARKTHLNEEGIDFAGRKGGFANRIMYTPTLLACVKALLELPAKAEPMYLVCRPDGSGYTVSGFSSMWRRIRDAWMKNEAAQGRVRESFTFHDLRAKAVTKALEDGRKGSELTGHTNEQMPDEVYDRRRIKKAKAAE